jgi:galactoside O-acetyltransferase
MDFAAIGSNVTIYPLARIIGPENISIGSNVVIDDFVFIGRHRSMSIGSHCHIAAHTLIAGGGDFSMDDFSNISGGCRIYTGSDDFSGQYLMGPTVPDDYRHITRMPVHIGRHAILGTNSVVLPGVTIGEGAAVGACTLVTRDLDPWTIYVGQPARAIKARPHEAILAQERQLLMMEQTRSTSDSGNAP